MSLDLKCLCRTRDARTPRRNTCEFSITLINKYVIRSKFIEMVFTCISHCLGLPPNYNRFHQSCVRIDRIGILCRYSLVCISLSSEAQRCPRERRSAIPRLWDGNKRQPSQIRLRWKKTTTNISSRTLPKVCTAATFISTFISSVRPSMPEITFHFPFASDASYSSGNIHFECCGSVVFG